MDTSEFTTEELAAEEFRHVVDHEGIYSVSNLGQVRRDKPSTGARVGRILVPSLNRTGYPIVVLHKTPHRKTRTIYRLVAAAFLGPRPEGMQINHIDGVKTNSRADNLEYVTRKQNMEHASRMGLVASGDRHSSRTHPERVARGDRNGARTHPERLPRGERHKMTTLTDDDVRLIRTALAAGESCVSIARRFGVSPSTISSIKRGELWVHVT